MPLRFIEHLLNGEKRRLGVQRVEDGFDQQHIGAPVEQPSRLVAIGRNQLIVACAARGGAIDVRRDRRRLRRRADRAGDETLPVLLSGADLLHRPPGAFGAGLRQLVAQRLHVVVGQRNRLRVECVRLDDIRARFQVLPMDIDNDVGLRQVQEIVVALDVPFPILEPHAAERRLVQLALLDHRPHRPVQDDDATAQQGLELPRAVRSVGFPHRKSLIRLGFSANRFGHHTGCPKAVQVAVIDKILSDLLGWVCSSRCI